MDEPLGALDKKLRDQMQVEIKRLHSELGTTILYVTHDQEEAMAMSDRICLMRDGAIEQLGTPAELYFEPRTVFAADFLGGANVFPLNRSADGAPCGPEGAPLRHRATRISPAEAGHFMIRPEHLRPLEAQETSDNTVSAVLEHVVMSGAVTRYYATLADGRPVVATRLTEGPPTARAGDSVRLGWSAERTKGVPGDVGGSGGASGSTKAELAGKPAKAAGSSVTSAGSDEKPVPPVVGADGKTITVNPDGTLRNEDTSAAGLRAKKRYGAKPKLT